MLGHDLEMSCAKFHENRLIIASEINEKHALQIVVSWTVSISDSVSANANAHSAQPGDEANCIYVSNPLGETHHQRNIGSPLTFIA